MILLPQYRGKKIGVFGMAKAGRATVASLLESGAIIYAADDKMEAATGMPQHAQYHAEPFAAWPWNELEMLVLAPGVPLTHPAPHAVVIEAQKHGCEVIGDIELLFRACPDARYIGITGTNGKSTTTALIGHILKDSGMATEVGGNLGTACLSLEPLGEEGIYVLELSSYQLDLLRSSHFDIACWMNITPDHLDRHGDMDGYVAAKQNIFKRQGAADVAIIGVDDAYSDAVAHERIAAAQQRVVPVSVKTPVQEGIYVKNDALYDEFSGLQTTYDLRKPQRLKGLHNWQNACIAYAACRAAGIAPERIFRAMETFEGLPHRMEWVRELDGVTFVNDSKATNADSTEKALATYDSIYWILGGKAKAGGISTLSQYFPRIRHAFLIGDAAKEFAATLEGRVPYTQCGTLEKATQQAAAKAQQDNAKDAVVLLSPACASFDQWPNFEARGDAFRSYANAVTSRGVKAS